MIDFIEHESGFGFKYIESKQSFADSMRGTLTYFIGNGTICCDTAARGVRDPISGGTINCANRLIAHHKGTDIASGFANVLLNIKHLMIDS